MCEDKALQSLLAPNLLRKIIPHVDCTPRIRKLVCCHLTTVTVKGVCEGPADLTLGRCEVAGDYMT